ncbi:sensor histidine kinase response receiver [Syntrophotalea carbinolica DSM 2380]|uniref:histidine kinase n=1 Tax=Syntrophotalea carbinolica (strain DSM 2380 / NBRC 103641 / GraBd1) TaxID=338963 RepID=Q3A0D4_SYNC1|nr:hybrid sensor histidine kinase/response regulator [Syntrophotalea carbinolica]ABA90173.1 sensor histidine kinase response receiver [Syntrophotalea carbinolica DSM 2380]
MNPSDCSSEKKSCDRTQNSGSGEEPESPFFAMNELLSLLGHELRTPLAGTMGMLELVLAGDLAADQRSALELANASARSMLRLIEDLHDLARMEAGRLQPENSAFEVRPWAREMLHELTRVGSAEITLDVDSRVPEIMMGDGNRIAHLSMSLIDIFLKHSRNRCVALHLDLETREGQSMLLVTIGTPGRLLEDRERVDLLKSCGTMAHIPMRAFRQVGLASALACNLAAALGGALWPKPGSQEQNIQVLAVPVGLPTGYEKVESEPHVAEDMPDMQRDLSTVRILLVEDDDAIRRLVELLLQQRGWQVTAVSDGLQALESFQANRFDLVLMDIRMPRLDGLETTRRIRRREQTLRMSSLPIVGMTAHAAVQDRSMCLEAGMDDYLSKPIASDRLYSIIERSLANRKVAP